MAVIRIPLLLVGVVACLAWYPAFGQAPVSDPGTLRSAYAKALEEWSAANERLERDWSGLTAPEMLARVAAVAELRAKTSAAKLGYAAAIERMYRACAAPAVEEKDTGPVSALLKADGALKADLDEVIAALDGEMRRVGATDRARVAALQKQKTELIDLRNQLFRRDRELERVRAGGETEAQAVAAARQACNRLGEWAGRQAALISQEDTDWQAYYEGLRTSARRRIAAERPAETAAAAPPVEAPATVVTTGSMVVPNIGGQWILYNPDARKLPSGAYEPLSVRLLINQDGDKIQGAYECTFAVPPDENYNPSVRFSFSGRITNPILRFDLTPPAQGSVLIARPNAGQLHVSYRVMNAGQVGIAFGEVPEDGPQVLSRRVR